ncbi:MAG: PLP-dependent aminotransferase family protein [Actinomycetota bacterium]|nr:PLP-dependent aminotransferase family protein [Actinomycetota bacterium]
MVQPILPLSLVRHSGIPLVAQVANRVRELVSTGVLRPGVRVPSIRALAADAGLARGMVESAYDQLIAEGWLTARRGAGTYVAEVGHLPAAAVATATTAATTAATATSTENRPPASAGAARPGPVQFDTGTPWLDPRHNAGWRRAWREVSAAQIPPGYPDPAGIPELRAELAGYVARTRGLSCSVSEVLVTGGATHGLALLLDVLGPGAVAIEDPGYRAAVAVAEQAGRLVVDVPVDVEGIDVRALRTNSTGIRVVYVTPAHQHPLGITMSAGRRVALLAEAKRRAALVVEDDYDSEFRYDVAPLPALAALDRDRVVYLGSASKSVHPGLRFGWMVAPPELIRAMVERRAARHDHPAWPVQRAFLAMLREGHVDRLVRSARRVYAQRSEIVVRALSPYGRIGAPVAGMYVTLQLPGPTAEAVRDECVRAGFDLPSLADYSRSSRLTGLVIGFGGVTGDQLSAMLDVLTATLSRVDHRN